LCRSVDSEVPAPEAGILLKRTVNEGDVVKVGELIAQIGEEAGKAAAAPEKPAPQQKTQPANGHSQESRPAAPAARQNVPRTGPGGKFYSPLVRNIARNEGIALEELETIEGSGMGGRVTKKDILDYLPS